MRILPPEKHLATLPASLHSKRWYRGQLPTYRPYGIVKRAPGGQWMLAGLTAVLFANAALALVVCGGYVLYAQRRAALNQAMCTFCLLLAIAK